MREYRQNAHAGSLIVWAALCVVTAVVLYMHSGHLVPGRALRAGERAGAAALLVFGPLAVAAYLLRARFVWVGVDGDRGIVVAGDRLIPWKEIVRIERRKPLLRDTAGPAKARSFPERASWLGGCADPAGCLAGEAALIVLGVIVLALALVVAFWLVFFVLIPVVLVPVLEVFLPVGDRVRIVTRKGRGLLLRDLRDADDFLREVGTRVPVNPR